MKNRKLKFIAAVIIVIAIAAAIFLFWIKSAGRNVANPALDAFAQCLSSKKITMYGAAWCPHCQNQKKLFGDSFKYIPYVECPDNPSVCLAKGVEGYPTWIFPDGSKLIGEQTLEDLSQKNGCPLPAGSR